MSQEGRVRGCVSIYRYICYKLTDVRQIKIAVIYSQKLEKENIVLSCFLIVYIEQLEQLQN